MSMSNTFRIQGLYTALITPFLENGELDLAGFEKNIAHQLTAGVDGLVVLGTTAESPTLTSEERETLIRMAVECVGGKVPIVVGTGTNCTETTIRATQQAKDLGVQASLIVTPYYNKPTQSGIKEHFEAVAEAVDFPIVVYNIEGRAGVNIATSTLQELMRLPQIVSVKEASGDVEQAMDVIALADNDFTVVSGNDSLTWPLMAVGGDGVIAVTSNLFPAEMKALVDAGRSGDTREAARLHYELLPVFRALFLETNPIPVKYAMNQMWLAAGHCRKPLSEPSDSTKNDVDLMLREFAKNEQITKRLQVVKR